MAYATGNIEAISIKPMATPDSYGNTFRASFKIGEDWYGYGSIKKESINVKDGSNWIQLAKGMGVEFQFTENGDFKNVKKASFTLTDATSSAPPQQSYQAPQQSSGATVSRGSSVNPATVGACLNLAIEVLGYTKKDFDDEEKLIAAIRWHKGTFDRMLALYPTVEVQVAEEKPKPVAKKKPVVVEEDMYDDDSI